MNNKFLCIYCGASERVDSKFFEAAEELGKMIAKSGFSMVYGGGKHGLMGRISSQVIAHDGLVVGVTTEQLSVREGVQKGLYEVHILENMHARKLKMSEQADAFLIMPGGFGTLDELFEMITWKQLGIHNKPIVIINIDDYWNPLIDLFYHIIDTDFAKKEHAKFIEIASSLEQAIEIVTNALK